MTEKIKPPVDKRFQIIQGGNSRKLQEPLVETQPPVTTPIVPPHAAAKIPEEARKKLNEIKARLEKGRERKITVMEGVAPIPGKSYVRIETEEAKRCNKRAIELADELGRCDDAIVLFALYDLLSAELENIGKVRTVAVEEGIQFDPEISSFEDTPASEILKMVMLRLGESVVKKLLEIFRRQLGIPDPSPLESSPYIERIRAPKEPGIGNNDW